MREKVIKLFSNIKNRAEMQRFLVIFYLVGTVGLLIPWSRVFFTKLIPFALLMNVGLLIIHHKNGWGTKDSILFIGIAVLGFVIEVVGVQTGLIFGDYLYGPGLGLKFGGTPLIIGVNWVLLVYTTATLTQKTNFPVLWRITLGASTMLVYDLVLEQVAPKMDMWSWNGDEVPIQNYVAWWIIAACFHGLIELFKIKIQNPLSAYVLIIQFIFFCLLFCLM